MIDDTADVLRYTSLISGGILPIAQFRNLVSTTSAALSKLLRREVSQQTARRLAGAIAGISGGLTALSLVNMLRSGTDPLSTGWPMLLWSAAPLAIGLARYRAAMPKRLGLMALLTLLSGTGAGLLDIIKENRNGHR